MIASASEPSVLILRALATPARMEICWLLAQGERAVTDIADELELPQPLTSHHLRKLKEAGLVKARRQGSWTYYALRPGPMAALAEELAGMVEASEAARKPPAGAGVLRE